MFYQWEGPCAFDGARAYIDLSDHLHRILQSRAFSADIVFCTEDPGYLPLLAVYYKESLLPDFSLCLHKGLPALTIRRGGGLKVLTGGEAVCDGQRHLVSFRGCEAGVRVYLDGELAAEDQAPGPWCEFGYVGFFTAGRGTQADVYQYFRGELFSLSLSDQEESLPDWRAAERLPRQDLFARGMAGVENYRIPCLLTVGDTTVACADARVEAPGDNPNHICRAVRISRDSGKTWSPIRLLCDYGGVGRADGAAAIDGSLLYDRQADVLFMLYSHTSAGVGAMASQPGTGFDREGRRLLWGENGETYLREPDGRIVDTDGRDTGFRADVWGRLTRDGAPQGSICHGQRLFRQADTSFLQIIESRDRGETWSEPRELNPQVKEEWMKFIGAGPGTGIQLREGPHRGRLLYPVYYSSENGRTFSSGAIYSDDHGRTWRRGASVNDGRLFEGRIISARDVDDPMANLGECQLAELPGGRVRIFLRNPLQHCTAAAFSDDGGESWHSFAHQEALPDPECQSHVLRIDEEERSLWLFSNPADETGRVRGTVRLSVDGTESWCAQRLIEPGEFAYSCMAQLPDGQIGILYEGRDLAQRFVRFPRSWLSEAGQ